MTDTSSQAPGSIPRQLTEEARRLNLPWSAGSFQQWVDNGCPSEPAEEIEPLSKPKTRRVKIRRKRKKENPA